MINQDIVKFIDCICEMAPRQNIKNRDATTQAYILSNFFDGKVFIEVKGTIHLSEK